MNPVFRYDFTLGSAFVKDFNEIIDRLEPVCKKFVFQLEEGTTNKYKHYQGRFSLIDKKRLNQIVKLEILPKETHYSVTCSKTKGFEYVMKDKTRINGPWKDSDKPKYIPRQYRGKMSSLRPFQKYILNNAYKFDDRTINLVICKRGNVGKSVVSALAELYKRGIDLPVVNDAEKLVQSCCNICMAKNTHNPSPIFIDLPRAFNQEKMNGIFIAIEQIKKGKLYDMRHHYKEWWIDSPQIWVFTNTEQNLEYLSYDRWKIWKINKSFELVKVKLNIIGACAVIL